jgi:hypothetical protein
MGCLLLRRAALSIACALALAASVAGSLPALAQSAPHRRGSLLGQQKWNCTELPRSVWLPLHVLHERLETGGVQVIEAIDTHDNCYHFRLMGPDRQVRTLVVDPVSGKALR